MAAAADTVLFADACGADICGTGACGTALRAIGRGLGKGTGCLAQAPADNTVRPTASARLVPNAIDRKAERLARVTAFLVGESFTR
jgi:hypothetical protein